MIYTTISTSRNNIEYVLGIYLNSGWEIVSRNEIGGSRYRVVLRREAKYLETIGMVGSVLCIGLIVFLLTIAM